MSNEVIFGSTSRDLLNQVRRRHIELLNQSLDRVKGQNIAPEITEFINQVADAGANLEAQDERATAQNILDYWNASLVSLNKREAAQEAAAELKLFVRRSEQAESPKTNPFRAIGAFGKDDRALLTARRDEIGAVVKKVREHKIVFITCPAGSGRSVLVTAGAVPRLEHSESDKRIVFKVSSPGIDPLAVLAATLKNTTAADLRRSPEALRDKINDARGDCKALVLIDNAEELFTRCSDPQRREAFARAIASVAVDPDICGVILIISNDQADNVCNLEALKPYATEAARLSLPPLTAAEIQRALLVQASAGGLRMDAEVVGDLAHELQGETAAFSLAWFMLLHLWPLNKGGFVGWDEYKKLGRPNEALSHVAEDTFRSLSPKAQDAAKRMFLRLANPEVGTATSHSVSRKDLLANAADGMPEALSAFEDAGLLRRSMRPDAPADSLKLVSDRLMFRWERLDQWLGGERQEKERLLLIARLWKDSGHQKGFLLSDKASIRQAEKYVDSTPEGVLLSMFIFKSKDERIRRIMVTSFGTLASVIVVLFVIIVGTIYHHFHEQESIDGLIDYLKQEAMKVHANETLTSKRLNGMISEAADEQANRPNKLIRNIERAFNWIWFDETFGAAEVNLSDINISHVNLHDSSFDNLRLIASTMKDINLSTLNSQSINLRNSAFNESEITDSRFDGSDLSFSQFRSAKLRSTDFSRANLYRAAFDNARLCDVDFTDASLNLTTFWNATFNERTKEYLRNTAWWLGRGWTTQQIQALMGQQDDYRDALEKRVNDFLKSGGSTKTGSVPSDIQRAYTHLINANGTNDIFILARTSGLNDWAWTLAINGVKLSKEQKQSNMGNKCDPEAPQTAQDSAEIGLCLVKNLDKNRFGTVQMEFEDTLGYILLQLGNVDDALKHLKEAAKLRNPDVLFRLAVAENASGNLDDALKDMQTSIGKGYVPTHERFLLAKYIVNDFEKELNAKLDGAYRSGAPAPACQD